MPEKGIDLEVFSDWIVVLSERYRQPLSIATQATYHDRLSKRLTTDQFVASAGALFDMERDKLPGTDEWVRIAWDILPLNILPPAPEPPLLGELTPEQQAADKAVRDLVREELAALTKQLSVKPKPTAALRDSASDRRVHLAKMQVYLKGSDPILRKEAISWAYLNSWVKIVSDDYGEVLEFEEEAETSEPAALQKSSGTKAATVGI